MKRTLITKLSTDVTLFTDEQIEAYRAFMKVCFAPAGFKDVSFEITQENEENALARWLQRISAEFQANDVPTEKSDEQQRPRD